MERKDLIGMMLNFTQISKRFRDEEDGKDLESEMLIQKF